MSDFEDFDDVEEEEDTSDHESEASLSEEEEKDSSSGEEEKDSSSEEESDEEQDRRAHRANIKAVSHTAKVVGKVLTKSDDSSSSSDDDSCSSSDDSSMDGPPARASKRPIRSKKKKTRSKRISTTSGDLSDSDLSYDDSFEVEEDSDEKATGCDYANDAIVAEVIDDIRDKDTQSWCRLFQGACFTNAGQVGHANLPPCHLNDENTKVTVPSMYVKDVKASNDLTLQAQTIEGTFHFPKISMTCRKFHTRPLDLTPLVEDGWRSTKIGNRYFMNQETGAETGGYALAQVVNKDNASELVVPKDLFVHFKLFAKRVNSKRGYAVFEVSRVGGDWFALWNLKFLGKEEGGIAPFQTNEKSKSALSVSGAAKRYKKEYETARYLGARGSGRMINEYEAETIREPISSKDYVPMKWMDGKFPEQVDEPRLEVPGLEICRTAYPEGGMRWTDKVCTFMVPKPLNGLTFDLHSIKFHKEGLTCLGLNKAQDGHPTGDGYRSALSALGASTLDVAVPEYCRIGEELQSSLLAVLIRNESNMERDAMRLHCVKTKKVHLEKMSTGDKVRRTAEGVGAVAAVTAGVVGALVASSSKKKKSQKSKEAPIKVKKGYKKHPIYQVTPVLCIGRRWYDPFKLTPVVLKGHVTPKKLRYLDIRIQKSKKKKSKKEKKKSSKVKEKKRRSAIEKGSSGSGGVGSKRAPHQPQYQDGDIARSVVSESTTKFADGSVTKETFFSDGTKVSVHTVNAPSTSGSVSSKKGGFVPRVVYEDQADDPVDRITEKIEGVHVVTPEVSPQRKKKGGSGSTQSAPVGTRHGLNKKSTKRGSASVTKPSKSTSSAEEEIVVGGFDSSDSSENVAAQSPPRSVFSHGQFASSSRHLRTDSGDDPLPAK